MKFLGRRMKNAARAAGMDDATIARRIEVAESTLRHYYKGTRTPRLETILEFSVVTDSSLDWLCSDEMEYTQMQRSVIDFDENEFTKINVYDVSLAAGPGQIATNESPIDQLAFRTSWLDRNGINPAHASIVRVEGDSMEPTLADGGIVLIDHRDKTPVSKSYIFAVRQDDFLMVKRVERSSDGKVLMLHSDNPITPTKALTEGSLANTEIIGRVVWSARTWPT